MAMQQTIQQMYPPEDRWYVLYVRSRTEKKVILRMERFGFHAYLPLIKVMRQWSDRKKQVEVPLFNGYMFVKTNPQQFADIRMVEGVVNFVKSEGKNAIISTEQIEAIKSFIDTGIPVTGAVDTFEPGEKVKITFGALSGFEGELVEVRNDKHFILRVEAINQVLIIDLPSSYIEKI